MAEVAKGIIDIEINTGSAASQLQALQTQINAFNLALNKSNKAQGTFAAEYSKELQAAINKTGLFTAETVKLSTAAATLDKTLSKGKTSLGQFFSAKFNKDSAIAAETMALAAERAKRLQTQFIATSGAANGMQEALAVRPLAAFSSELSVAAQRTQILSNMFKQGTTQLINFGKNVQWAGRQLMVGFTVPLTIFGAMAGKTFMDLEKQMVAFKKVYGDITTTTADTNKNLEAVKGLASEYTKYGIAVKDTIGLAAQAAAAGRKDADLKDAVSQATRLATLGQMDQNAALETTISLQSAFRLSGQDLADTINFLNMVENQTVVSLQDIAAAIPRVAPVIQGLGGNVKDLTVFLAAMQEGGVDAAEGANALKSGLASLINPTKQATEMLSGMGINLQSIIQANKGDLMGTVQSFAQALSSLDQFSRQQALEQVFGKFQYAKLGALFDNISRKGSQAQQVIATMGYTTEQLGATADKELKTIEESFGVQLTGAVERFKLAIAPIGQLFVQLAIPVVNFITKIVEGFNSLSDGQKKFAAIGAVIVGVVIPALTMMAGLFLNLVGTLAKMSQSMALFTKGFITGGPVGAFKALSQSSKYLSLAEIDAAMAAQQLSGASQVLNTTLIEQVGTANAAAAAIANLTKAYGAMAATQGAASGLPSFGVAGAAGANAAKGVKTGGIRIRGLRRNSGGGVPGSGNTDTVPAMLTPGEFVVNKEATKDNLGLLKAINDGRIQKFSQGGGVLDEIAAVRNIGFGATGIPSTNSIRRSSTSSSISSSQRAHTTSSDLTTLVDDLRTVRGIIPAGSQIQVLKNRVLNIGHNQQLKEGGQGIGADAVLRDITTRGSSMFNTMDGQFSAHINNVHQQLVSSGVSSDDAKKQISKLVKDYNSSKKQVLSSYVDELSKLGTTLIDDKTFAEISDKAFSPMSNSSNIGISQFHSQLMDNGSVRFTRSSLIQTAQNLGVPGITGKEKTRKEILSKINKFLESQGKQKIDMETGGKGRTFSLGKPLHYEKFAGVFKGRSPIVKVLGAIFGRRMADGGIVPGSGNSDTVPAMLTPGEFVVNKKATSQNQELLKMMNGGKVQGYQDGGEVPTRRQRLLSGAKKVGGSIGVSGMVGYGIGEQLGGTMGGIAGSFAMPMIAKAAGPLIAQLGISTAAFAGIAAPLAIAGFAIYKFNQQINNAEKSGAEFTKAMYGTSKTIEGIAQQFGTQTYAQAARISAVEKAGGQAIGQQAQQQSAQFVQSDAGKQMLKDVGTVKAGGGNAVEALRNQLSAAIISGAIGTEEARAIAAEVGTALNDQSLAVNVSGELTRMMGPDGKDMLKNLSTITAEISPKIDATKLAVDAKSAYEKMNAGAKFVQAFQGGEAEFVKNYKLNEISAANSAAFAKEAQARQLLNIAYQEGTITLKDYQKQQSAISNSSTANQNLIAQSLGLQNQSELVAAAGMVSTKTTAAGKGAITTQTGTAQQKQAKAVLDAQKKEVETFLKEIPGATDDTVNKMVESISKLGAGAFGDILSGKIDLQDINLLVRMSDSGMSEEDIAKVSEKLQLLRTIPNIDKVISFNSAGKEEIDYIYKRYEEFDALPDVEKNAFFKANTSELEHFGTTYDKIAALPNIEKFAIMRNIEIYQTIREDINKTGGDQGSRRDLADQVTKINSMIKSSTESLLNGNGGATSGGGGGGGGKQSLKDYIKEFEKATKAKEAYLNATIGILGTEKQEALALIDTEMYLKANAKQREHLISLAERQLNVQRATAFLSMSSEQKALLSLEMQGKVLDNNASKQEKALRVKERELDLNNRALEDLAEREDAVNKTYDTRLEALDNVSKANDRLAEQDRSRIDLASALASGDIAAAANAANQMQQQSAQYQIEDTKAALEVQRKRDLESLTVSVNGKLMTRNQLEEANKNIATQIQTIQDGLYDIETQRLTLAEKRAAAELRIYLLQQKQTIEALKSQKKLTNTQKDQLATLIADFQNLSGTSYAQYKKYGGHIAKMAFGSTVPGRGMTDKVPAMLTPGEFVVRKPVADKNRSFLDALNGQVFPGLGGRKAPANNFLDGIGSPKYSIPQSSVSDIPISNTSVVTSSAPMYNSTYNVNVNVSGTNASPDDIANVVMAKLSQQNRGNLRSNRY